MDTGTQMKSSSKPIGQSKILEPVIILPRKMVCKMMEDTSLCVSGQEKEKIQNIEERWWHCVHDTTPHPPIRSSPR